MPWFEWRQATPRTEILSNTSSFSNNKISFCTFRVTLLVRVWTTTVCFWAGRGFDALGMQDPACTETQLFPAISGSPLGSRSQHVLYNASFPFFPNPSSTATSALLSLPSTQDLGKLSLWEWILTNILFSRRFLLLTRPKGIILAFDPNISVGITVYNNVTISPCITMLHGIYWYWCL